MQSENRFFDDLAKMVNGVAGTVAGAGREAEAAMRERAKEWVGRMDFVSREEFEAVKQMAATARAETEALKARLDKLEGGAKPAAAAKAAKPARPQSRQARKRREAESAPRQQRRPREGGGRGRPIPASLGKPMATPAFAGATISGGL